MKIINAKILFFFTLFWLTMSWFMLLQPVYAKSLSAQGAQATQSADAAQSTDAAKGADAAIGKVTWSKGSFKAIAGDKSERILEKGSPIFLHDTLVTGSKSNAGIVFTDNTLMTFRENTKFHVAEYKFNPQSKVKSVGKYIGNLIEGGFRTIDGLIAERNAPDYQVTTAVATIGVRGTEYSVYLNKGQIYMNFYSGKPIITNAKGTVELSKERPYIFVPGADFTPVYLKEKPAVFKEELKIVPAIITPPESIAKISNGQLQQQQKQTQSPQEQKQQEQKADELAQPQQEQKQDIGEVGGENKGKTLNDKEKDIEVESVEDQIKRRPEHAVTSGGAACSVGSGGGLITGFTLKLK